MNHLHACLQLLFIVQSLVATLHVSFRLHDDVNEAINAHLR